MEGHSSLRRIGALAALLGVDTSRLEKEIVEEMNKREENDYKKYKKSIERFVTPRSVARASREIYHNLENDRGFRAFDYFVDDKMYRTSMLMGVEPSFRNFQLAGSSYRTPVIQKVGDLSALLSTKAKSALVPLAKRVDVRSRIAGTRIWDDPCFRLTSWGDADEFISTFDICSFMDYRWTGGLLEDELKETIVASERDGEEPSSPNLNSFRRAWMPDVGSVLDLQNRVCCGGVSVLTAIARDDDFLIPLQRRSQLVADSQNQLATIPKGLHQPLSSARENVQPYWTVMREFYEELFEGDVERKQKRLSHDWWIQDENAVAVRYLIENPGSHQTFGLGFGFNLATGNYEYCCLLIVNDTRFIEKYAPHGSWETSDLIPMSSKDTQFINSVLTNESLMLVNESIPSFVRGIGLLQQMSPTKVSSPHIREC